MWWNDQPTAQRKLKSLTNLKNNLEKGRNPSTSKVKTPNPFSHSSVLQNQNPNAAAKKKEKRKRKKRDWRKLGLGLALIVGMERKNERGGEQELREKSRVRMRKERLKF